LISKRTFSKLFLRTGSLILFLSIVFIFEIRLILDRMDIPFITGENTFGHRKRITPTTERIIKRGFFDLRAPLKIDSFAL